MTQIAYIKNSLSVAIIAALWALLPTIIAAGSLYVIARAFGIQFNELYVTLVALVTILGLSILRPGAKNGPVRILDSLNLGGQLLARWFGLLGALLVLGYVTGFTAEYERRVILTWATLTPIILFVLLILLNRLMRHIVLAPENSRTAVVAGVNTPSLELADKIAAHPELQLHLDGFFDDRSAERLGSSGDFPLLGRLSELADYVRTNHVDVIFISLPMRHVQRVMDLINDLHDTTASIYYLPDLFVFDLVQSRASDVMGVPVVSMCETPFYGFRGVIKRTFDVVVTLFVLIFALPVMAVCAAAIKLTSRGPVIFRQRRYGLDGREFVVYKFRSMYITEDGAEIKQAERDDPRTTPVGHILRRLSLDELPQLFNVLQGRMSLVGPRPHAVAHNEEYRRQIKGYMIRHKVLPGITGLAQINGFRGETKELEQMASRVSYDLEYLRQWSPLLDLKILALTAVRLISDRHAY